MLRRSILVLALFLLTAAGTGARADASGLVLPVGPSKTPSAPTVHLLPNIQTAAQLGMGQRSGIVAPATAANLTYHNGPVMHMPTVYVIYWLPDGLHFEPSTTAAGDSNYESLVNRFFGDVNDSPLYGLLTQYSDGTGAINNYVHFAGSWVDPTPYGHTGSTTDPLHDADIQAEVSRAMSSNHWTAGANIEFFVYTAMNINSCSDLANTSCTFATKTYGGYCAYHSSFPSGSTTAVYSNMGDIPWDCTVPGASPHNDATADSRISMSSHEFFESVSDPLLNAWFDSSGAEIGDKCAWAFGPRDASGANVLFWPGDGQFVVQQQWSNRSSACELQLPPTVTYLTSHEGPAGGGSVVTIQGTGLLGVVGQMSFSFGPYAVTNIGPCSTVECQVTIPTSHPASFCEPVDVSATVAGLPSSPTAGDQYRYYAHWPLTPVDSERACVGTVLNAS
jgi:hypothetical protein